ncbi:MAG: polysaccharide deacetylase family protein [Candidatus Berkelbacteria bacterium]|nr:polysaccharide deacetylase family protein [Candidatus Berkelbacteria bacterium]
MKNLKLSLYFRYTLIIFLSIFALAVVLLLADKITNIRKESKAPLTPVETDTLSQDDMVKNTPITSLPNLVGGQNRIPILMYHYIRDLNDPSDKIGTNLSVSPANFAKELGILQAHDYTTVTFEEIAQNPALTVKNPIILSFDDGYEDFYTAAYPELKKHQMKAVSYVITGKVGGEYMTAAQIKEISDYGIEIGSHTISHPDLRTLNGQKLKSELTESKATLEAITGKTVISFCYPSGKYNDMVVAAVKNAGYLDATTTNPGLSNFDNLFELSRYRMNPTTELSGILK